MKAWSAIFNFIAMMIIVILAAAYINMCEVFESEFNQERYNYAVRQATEAMFRTTLKSEDIDIDYTDMSYVHINATDAIAVFDRVMCANYELSANELNFDAINNSILGCIIAGFDGYYVLTPTEVDRVTNGSAVDGYTEKFGMKIPYYVQNDSMIYAIDAYKHTYSALSLIDTHANPVLYTIGTILPDGVDEDEISAQINKQVRAKLIDCIQNSNNKSLKNIDNFNIYFPETQTVTGVNPFEVPGIFMLTQGNDYSGTSGSLGLSVAGYKVVRKLNVIAFTDTLTNKSYYCYEGQLKDEEKDALSGGVAIGGVYGNYSIENYFDTFKEACEAVSPVTGEHYAPYYEILARKSSYS